MNSLSRTLAQFGLVIGIGLIGAGHVFAEDKTSNVVVEKDRIVIPGTNLSREDQQAMNNILMKYDKSLYKIETYKNGRLKKTRGTLTDIVTDKRLASEIAENVKKKGFTQFAIQVTGQPETGRGAHPTQLPTPIPGPTGGTTANPTRMPTPIPGPTGGTTANPTRMPTPIPGPTGGTTAHPTTVPPPPPPIRGVRAQKESEEFLERLKPILEKYSKK